MKIYGSLPDNNLHLYSRLSPSNFKLVILGEKESIVNKQIIKKESYLILMLSKQNLLQILHELNMINCLILLINHHWISVYAFNHQSKYDQQWVCIYSTHWNILSQYSMVIYFIHFGNINFFSCHSASQLQQFIQFINIWEPFVKLTGLAFFMHTIYGKFVHQEVSGGKNNWNN